MARSSLPPAFLSSLLSAVAILGVVGYQAYSLIVTTQPTPVPETTSVYQNEIITTELNPNNAKSILLLTRDIKTQDVQAPTGAVKYDAGELGKNDISLPGQ
jgi:hypothetical protein